jgi:hypothetical protein
MFLESTNAYFWKCPFPAFLWHRHSTKPHGRDLQVFGFEGQGRSLLAVSDFDFAFIMDCHGNTIKDMIDNTRK